MRSAKLRSNQRSVQCYFVCPVLAWSKWEASRSASCGSWDCRPQRQRPRAPDESKQSSAGPNRLHPDEQLEAGCGKGVMPKPTIFEQKEHHRSCQEKGGRRVG